MILIDLSESTTSTPSICLTEYYDLEVPLGLESLQPGQEPPHACRSRRDRYQDLVTIASTLGLTPIRPGRPARNVAITDACIDVQCVLSSHLSLLRAMAPHPSKPSSLTCHGDCLRLIMSALHRHRCMHKRSARGSRVCSPPKTTTAIEPLALDLSVLASDGPASQ